MAKVYLGLGTNLGDKELNLRIAIQKLEKRMGEVISLSAFYTTEPWGFASENSFLNAALCIETPLSPMEVLETTQEIERQVGRIHKSQNGQYADRLIDIDLLLFEGVTMKTERLTLPHPLLVERDFVMIPLMEIDPEIKSKLTALPPHSITTEDTRRD